MPIVRRSIVLICALFAGATLRVDAAAPKPNLLFILADDLGWADTTLYGHTKFYRTPNLERLARRGMTFTRAYAASPLCSPTRSSILTGLSPARTGITVPNCHMPQVVLEATPGKHAPPGKKAISPVPPTRLNTTYYTLAEALKAAGYATGHFGKWHLGREPYSPLEQGFDVDVPHWPGPGPAGSYVAPWKFPDFDPDTPNEHIEDRMAREAVRFLEQHQAEPFFLNYWMFSVHAPFDAKRALIEKYRARVNPRDPQRCPTYAAMVESMDDAVGTLLDALDRLGLTKNTIIVFFSDNGGNMYSEVDGTVPTSNAPLRGGKATVFEGGIRVPLIVSWPGIAAPGTRSPALVQSCDFYPTILDMLGLKPRPGQHFDGASFVPALRGQTFERGPIFTYFPHDPPVPDWLPASVAVHQGDWKLIRIFYGGEHGAHRWKLFNLREDLGEKLNLADREPERVQQLDAVIEHFLSATKAVVPRPNPDFDPAQYHPEDEGKPRIRNKAAKQRKAGQDEFPGLQGWKARQCMATVKQGIVTLTSAQASPFLGVASGVSGPARVTFRVRCPHGGAGKVEWIPPKARAQSVPFTLRGGNWENVSVEVPATGRLGIFRVYLPAQTQPVDLDWIELSTQTRPIRRWDF